MMLIERRKTHYLLYENWMVLHLNKLKSKMWIPFTQGCIVHSLVEIGPAVLEIKMFFSSIYFCYLVISPLGNGGLLFEQTWVLIPKNALCQVWLILAEGFRRRRFFNFVNVFLLFGNYLSFEKTTDKFWSEKLTWAFGSGELKTWKICKNHRINMKITGAHLQTVVNECTNFQKNPCTHFLGHAWTESCPQTGDRQTDKQTDKQTDRRTDRVKTIYPKLRLRGV